MYEEIEVPVPLSLTGQEILVVQKDPDILKAAIVYEKSLIGQQIIVEDLKIKFGQQAADYANRRDPSGCHTAKSVGLKEMTLFAWDNPRRLTEVFMMYGELSGDTGPAYSQLLTATSRAVQRVIHGQSNEGIARALRLTSLVCDVCEHFCDRARQKVDPQYVPPLEPEIEHLRGDRSESFSVESDQGKFRLVYVNR